ncbi:hypothetical protein B0J18DRAFT_441675 [Chaetomium sp. MPI-SDFR-AT-0129]|nr:hypothetical protein B0J18DRAFT_441675 [Chaetomium sp. MPI-SDFR-AT-0129]
MQPTPGAKPPPHAAMTHRVFPQPRSRSSSRRKFAEGTACPGHSEEMPNSNAAKSRPGPLFFLSLSFSLPRVPRYGEGDGIGMEKRTKMTKSRELCCDCWSSRFLGFFFFFSVSTHRYPPSQPWRSCLKTAPGKMHCDRGRCFLETLTLTLTLIPCENSRLQARLIFLGSVFVFPPFHRRVPEATADSCPFRHFLLPPQWLQWAVGELGTLGRGLPAVIGGHPL